MSDCVDRSRYGEVYVEISNAHADGFQIRLSQWGEPKEMFVTQAMDSDGTAGDPIFASEISIEVQGADRMANVVKALRWLADALPGYIAPMSDAAR